MRGKFFFGLVLVLICSSSNLLAQTPAAPPVKKISGGVLNGKAQTLTKPAFPAAAKAVRASGAVNVQVTIDENGDVISAAAVSGHPLLRQVSEQAALTSKFAPTLLEGQPVSVTGIIVYNFVSPMSLTQIGYELSLAENSQSLKKYQIASIAGTFPNQWEEEKEALKNLDSLLTAKPAKEESSRISVPEKVVADKVNPPNGSYQGSTGTGIVTRIGSYTGNGGGDANFPLDNDAIVIVRELQSKIESRLSVNENALWSFRLGKIAGKLKAEIESDEKTRANISELNQLGANIPTVFSEPTSATIKELVQSAQQSASNSERKEKLLRLIESLRNGRTY